MKKLLAFMLVCGSVLACLTACGDSGCDCKDCSCKNSAAAEDDENDTMSNIHYCDEAAISIKNGCNAALYEICNSGKVSGSGWIEFVDGKFMHAYGFKFEYSGDDSRYNDLNDVLYDFTTEYFSDFDKFTGAVYINNYKCTAVVLKFNEKPEYWGTYPSGVITRKGISEEVAKAAVAEFTE